MFRNLFKIFIKFHGFTICCGIGILILCIIKIPQQWDIPQFQFPNFDKVVHFTMYFTLSIAFILESEGMRTKPGKKNVKPYIAAFLLSAIFGGLIEIMQGTLTTYRSCDVFDWLTDMGGALIGCIVIGLLRRAFR
jgi:VanZ family protein